MARPSIYTPSSAVRLRPLGYAKLQKASDRRAIIDMILDAGGAATIAAINDHFGYDQTAKVAALVRAGWLELVP